MRHHYRSLSDTKQQYGEIFRRQKEGLETNLASFLAEFACESCALSPESLVASNLEPWLKPLHAGCGYIGWQKAVLQLVEGQMAGQVVGRLNAIEAYKNTFSCHMCGMCCRMASSDAPYKTLLERAKTGDDFARQFTSVFLPYTSREAAQSKAPDVVAAVLAEAGGEAPGEEKIFFYHCPYVGEDNRCTVYGTDKRPAICGSYPETPLAFVYENCAWKPWKEETHPDTLAAHAMLALCEHLSQQLRLALADVKP